MQEIFNVRTVWQHITYTSDQVVSRPSSSVYLMARFARGCAAKAEANLLFIGISCITHDALLVALLEELTTCTAAPAAR